ncbi:MAG TPA: vanadium-dependent haloperoxidase [Vicinamibacterales bacterium]|nr:vanadium-dependent haloperoxidase [Vicinamibacterales bacterium]
MLTAVHRRMTFSVRRRAAVVTLGVGVCFMATPAPARAADPVLEWNDVARQLSVVPALAPVQQIRAMAIVHVAVHDAVAAVTGVYEQHRSTSAAPPGASAEAAAIGAAYGALKGLFGDSAFLAAAYTGSLAAHAISPADPGLAFGGSVAEGILALRQHDGAAVAAYPYIPPDAGTPGVWTPMSAAASAQALLPGWGNVTPWVLRSGSQFRPDPPPALDGERYARDYNEVAQIGALVSATRTDEQTQIALFWRASPTALWNPLLRHALQSQALGLADTARTAALFYLAAADASVACWEAKYFYNFWRPQPAIVNGDVDGNDATTGDAAWRPLLPTPAHPDFVSGHAVNSAAMATVLADIFGDAPGFAIQATSPQNIGFVRSWQTFSEGAEEVVNARVYSGIHFRTADDAGVRQGRQVARFVLTHALRPIRGR